MVPTGGRHQPGRGGRGRPAGGWDGPDPHRNNRYDHPRRAYTPSGVVVADTGGGGKPVQRLPARGGSGPARGDDGRRGGTPSTRWGEKKANRTPAEGVGTNASPTAAHSAWRLCRAGHRRVRVPSESPPPPCRQKGPHPPRPAPPRGVPSSQRQPRYANGVWPRDVSRDVFAHKSSPPRQTSRGGSWGGEGGCARSPTRVGKRSHFQSPHSGATACRRPRPETQRKTPHLAPGSVGAPVGRPPDQ